MANGPAVFNNRQRLYKELVVGTLIYAVVLGFFDDYTNIVEAKSFSTIFLASIVLEVLTCLAFVLKRKIVAWLGAHQEVFYRGLMFFCVWFVMFISKFVFVWMIDLIFGSNMNINGFFGILAVVATVTALHRLADYWFIKLGD